MLFSRSCVQIVSPCLTLRFRLKLFNVQEAQAILQNPALDRRSPSASSTTEPKHRLKLMKFLRRFCLLSLSFVSCSVLLLECFVSFRFYVSVLFLSALFLLLPLFMWVLWAMHSVIYLHVVCPAFNVFAPFVGFTGHYIWFSILFALLLKVCPLFVWALRSVLFTYVLCRAVYDLP